MSAPKETPRQKMIGMMYLVLTAMLALNVSTEVLNSFVTVNDALEKTNQNYVKKNDGLYDIFQQAYAANEAKVADQWHKAQEVQAKTKELYNYLQQTKYELVAMVEGISIEEAKNLPTSEIGKQDNYDDPTRFFMGKNDVGKNGRAYVLHDMLDEYRLFLQSILGPDTSKVSLAALDVNGEYHDASGAVVNWETFNFYHTIIVADLALLNRLQTTVLNVESDVVSQLYSSVSEDDFKFDTISARVVPTSSNVVVGSDFEADIFVAAFDSKSKITATINGQQYEGEAGSIRYRVPANTTGEKTLSGTIDVPGTFGIRSYPFEFKYNVNEPMATVSADAMNVFYVGVDNPISAMAAGIPDKDIRVEISEGTLTKTGSGTYIARVSKPGGKVFVKVFAKDGKTETLMGSKEFRIKRVPDPVARINGQDASKKKLDKNALVAAGGLVVEMKDFDFDLPGLKIASFNVQISRNQELTPVMASDGNRFSEDILNSFQQCRRGNKVFFTDIVAKMPDGNRSLNDIVITIQ